MENFGVADLSSEVFEILSLLRPYDIDLPSFRVGPPRDGGYVMADRLADQDVISFGISNDVRFEKALAENGHRCFMYDHTIEDLPENHGNFYWQKLGVSGTDGETDELLSVKRHLQGIESYRDLLMKIDVEGAEWDVFGSMDPGDLTRFEQITGEFHWFMRLDEPAFAAKVKRALINLARYFTIFHVHANNCRPLGFVGGFAVADVLELSFIRRDLVTRRPSFRIFPDEPDMGNNRAIADHALLFYPFFPGALPGKVDDLIARLQADKAA